MDFIKKLKEENRKMKGMKSPKWKDCKKFTKKDIQEVVKIINNKQ